MPTTHAPHSDLRQQDLPAPLTDEQIVERVLAGDSSLFEVLMRRNNQRVYRTVRAVLRDEAEAEDAMQAAYVLAYSKLRSFNGSARFSTWLTRIALNEALGRVRRSHRPVDLAVVEESSMSFATPPVLSPEDRASERELAVLLEHAVDALPELYRVTFVLREVEGLDTAETASLLAVSEEVVKTRLSRARSMLRDGLAQRVGGSVREAFGFHATRCDRVVANVMKQIAFLPRP